MKNNKKWFAAAGVIALSGTLAFAAPHDGMGRGHHGHRGGMEMRLAKKLNLTDAQKEQWKEIRKNFREENKAFFESARQTRQDFRAAKEAGDTAKLDALKATMQSQRAQFKSLRQQQESKFETILTPDQKAQLDQLKAERAARRAERQHEQK